MSPHQNAVAEELHRIAPEIDLAEIDRTADLREECDIDSMDFLNLVTALSKRFGIEMPEADYDQMRSFDTLARYLETHAA
jgi:acyl carrier protein